MADTSKLTHNNSGEGGEDRLAISFQFADSEDWRHLFSMLNNSGHGRFWRAVFLDVLKALNVTPPAFPPPPAGASGGSDVVSARLIQWEPGQQGVEITLTGNRSVAIPLSQTTGGVGGGSSDLAAQGEPVARDDAQRQMTAQILTGIRGGNATGTTAEMLCSLAESDEIAFPLAGGMERPHLRERASYLEMAYSTTRHLEEEFKQAPAAPRLGIGVTVEEIAELLQEHIDLSCGGLCDVPETARAIFALIQAPRLGMTGDGRGVPVQRIIEAADCIGVRGAHWALTIEWADGAETVEHVSNHAACALLGYWPDEDDGEAFSQPHAPAQARETTSD